MRMRLRIPYACMLEELGKEAARAHGGRLEASRAAAGPPASVPGCPFFLRSCSPCPPLLAGAKRVSTFPDPTYHLN